MIKPTNSKDIYTGTTKNLKYCNTLTGLSWLKNRAILPSKLPFVCKQNREVKITFFHNLNLNNLIISRYNFVVLSHPEDA